MLADGFCLRKLALSCFMLACYALLSLASFVLLNSVSMEADLSQRPEDSCSEAPHVKLM